VTSDALPTPPPDPRVAWGLPPPGGMPPTVRLDALTTRLLAPNPSPMTLDGTNTYLVSVQGSGGAVVIDPGPDDPDHLARAREALASADAAVDAILLTHHHVDHVEAAAAWSEAFGAPLAAAAREVAGPGGRLLADGDTLHLGAVTIEVIATPGHTSDHLAFRLPTGALLTGDHVLGRGTSVVAHPDGDLVAYLDSLRRVLDLGADALFPGHGPELTRDPTAVVRYYLAHREVRQQQVLAVLQEGPHTPAELVARIYAEVDRRLWPAAEASTRAAVVALVADGRAHHRTDDRVVRVDA
jgi:glyoxylase-like metal-dependent hydrolase (beta-lactamase superfamily II)